MAEAGSRVAVVGGGYVGITTAASLARLGHDVTIVDIDPEQVATLQEGKVPIHEPGLPELVEEVHGAGRFHATTDHGEALAGADVVFICVNTPSREDGSIDLSYVEAAVRDVGKALPEALEYPVIVVKSTVVPGTTRDVVQPALEEASGRRVGEDLGLAMNPEFLREGSAVEDARHPDRIVVGSDDPRSLDIVMGLYAAVDTRRVRVDPPTAEMVKYAANAFLATKITFANEMANVAEKVGTDVYDVMDAMALDHRIERAFLNAGAGFGGSCFPKDVRALRALAEDVGVPSGILDAVVVNEDEQPRQVLRILREALLEHGRLEADEGDREGGEGAQDAGVGGEDVLEGERVALLGLSFKPGTDDVRKTRAEVIYRELVAAGADVVTYDPAAMGNFQELVGEPVEQAGSALEALEDAGALVVQTAWPEFGEITPEDLTERMARPLVVDGRRTFDPEAMWRAGVDYRAIGLGGPRGPRDPDG